MDGPCRCGGEMKKSSGLKEWFATGRRAGVGGLSLARGNSAWLL